ncbi:hypothetical protein [Euzebya tangerina]|uniref:hypothetical protein n=1 Tax=Euzebya tangerina TaxID=591198 RepID=UPI000E324169|nr:hypothetical protein [Euzebya tangerina]
MGTLATAATLGTGLVWLATGSDRAGRRLVDVATSEEEDGSLVAVMMLTRGGDRAVPLLERAARGGEPDLATVLLGIGSDQAGEALGSLARSDDPAVARAGAAALHQLERARDRPG